MSKAKFALQKTTVATAAIAGRAITEAQRSPEGGTLCPFTGEVPNIPYGYWVGGRIPTLRTSPEDLHMGLARSVDRLVREGRRACRVSGWKPVGIGWWRDANGTTHWDVSTWVGDLAEALALGRKRGEISDRKSVV